MQPTIEVRLAANRDPKTGHLTPFQASIFKGGKEVAITLLHGPVRGISIPELLWYAVILTDLPIHSRWVHKQIIEFRDKFDDRDWMIDSYEYKEDTNEVQESRQ